MKRRFSFFIRCICLCLILFCSFPLFTGCAASASLQSETSYFMDTAVTITLSDGGEEGAMAAAFDEISRLEAVFSAHKKDSELSLLNKQRSLSPLSEDLTAILMQSLSYANLTEGAFNPFMGTLINLWGITTENPAVPTPADIEQAKVHTSDSSLTMDDKGATFTDDKALIDLGAIAKGYSADKAADVLRQKGVKSAILSMGGNVVAIGGKDEKNGWKIGIRDPLGNADEIIGYVNARDISVVTSGAYERYFEKDGVRYHHILDPSTGYPADAGLISVTVLSEDGTLADMLSTAVFVMGKEKAKALLEQLSEPVQLILVDENHQITVLGQSLAPFTKTNEAYSNEA